MIPENDILKIEKRDRDNYIKKLEAEKIEMEEKLKNYIPRRRVRRIFKSLKNILEQDLEDENKIYVEKLKVFIQKIEKEGPQTAGQDIKQAIEHLLSIVELKGSNDDEIILYSDSVPVQTLYHQPKKE